MPPEISSPTINPLSCHPPEQACSDTPATSDPYGNGDDYMSYRKDSSSSTKTPPLARDASRPAVYREASTQYLSLKSIEGDGYYGGHPLRQTQVVGDGNGDDGKTTSAGEEKDAEGLERNRARRDASDGTGHGPGHRGSSAQRHGRIRGEVTLDGDEADVER